jgi:tetratricopeptide (TPR) repeat protein
MRFSVAKVKFPSLINSLLAILSAILLTLAFPDYDLWFLAWFALVPLFYAIEGEKESPVKSFVLGWIFGTCFFFASCSLYKNGNDDEAMLVLQRIIVSEPMSAEAFFLRGMINLRRGNLDESVAQLRTALFWDNRLINAHVALGKIYLQRGDCLQAKNYAASAIAIDAENQDAIGLVRQIERCGK